MSYVTITIWVICSIFLIVAWATAESNSKRGIQSTKTAKKRIKALDKELSVQIENLEHAQNTITEIKNTNDDLMKFKEAYYALKKENARTNTTNQSYAELINKMQTRLSNTEYAGNALATVLSAEIDKYQPKEDPNLKDDRVQSTFQKMRKSMK